MLFLQIWAALRLGFDPTQDLRLVKVMATALGTYLIINIISSMVPSSFNRLLIIPPIGLLVYLLLAIQLNAIGRAELRNTIPVLKR